MQGGLLSDVLLPCSYLVEGTTIIENSMFNVVHLIDRMSARDKGFPDWLNVDPRYGADVGPTCGSSASF